MAGNEAVLYGQVRCVIVIDSRRLGVFKIDVLNDIIARSCNAN